MDALTLVLIALGAVGVLAFIVVAYLEVVRKPRRSANPASSASADAPKPAAAPSSAAPAGTHVQATPAPGPGTREIPSPSPAASRPAQPSSSAAQASAPAPAPVAAPRPAVTTATSRPAPIVAGAPAPTGEIGARVAGLSSGARAALLRLSVMPSEFSRDTARAVASCVNDDLQALAQSGLVEFDPVADRFALSDAVRERAAAEVTSEEAHAARLRHAEHYIHCGLEAQKPVEQQGSLVALALELFVQDAAHFHAAFEFLRESPGLERQLVKLVEAVGYTSVLDLPRSEARRWLEAALTAAEGLGDESVLRDIHNALAGRATEDGDFPGARGHYEKVVELSRQLGDRHEEGRALGNLGLTTHRLGDHATAIGYYEQVLEIMRESGDRRREGLALSSLAQAVADSGDPRRAIEIFGQHLAIASETNDHGAEAYALAGIGRAHVALDELDSAIKLFEQQRTMAQRARDLAFEGAALGSLGEVYLKLGQHEKVLECYSRQLDVAHLLGQAEAGVRALGHMGNAHQACGRTSKALECFDEQLRVARKVGDREGEALALANAARIVHFRGQIVDAITRASAALPIFDEIKSPEATRLRAEIDQWRSEQG